MANPNMLESHKGEVKLRLRIVLMFPWNCSLSVNRKSVDRI